MAAIISAQDLGRLSRFEEHREKDLALLEASWKAFEGEDPEKIEREVAKAVAEVRAEARKRAPSRP